MREYERAVRGPQRRLSQARKKSQPLGEESFGALPLRAAISPSFGNVSISSSTDRCASSSAVSLLGSSLFASASA
jgi:hypothetical protein